MVARQVFLDSSSQHLSITFDGEHLNLLVNLKRHPDSLILNNGAAAFKDFGRMSKTLCRLWNESDSPVRICSHDHQAAY